MCVAEASTLSSPKHAIVAINTGGNMPGYVKYVKRVERALQQCTWVEQRPIYGVLLGRWYIKLQLAFGTPFFSVKKITSVHLKKEHPLDSWEIVAFYC